MRLILTLAFIAKGMNMFGQQVITLTEDVALTETWTFTENTIVKSAPGQNYTISCAGDCKPTFLANDCHVHFEEVQLGPTARRTMASVKGGTGKISWDLVGTKGIVKNGRFLPGEPVPPRED